MNNDDCEKDKELCLDGCCVEQRKEMFKKGEVVYYTIQVNLYIFNLCAMLKQTFNSCFRTFTKFVGTAIASSVYNDVDEKEVMVNDPRSEFIKMAKKKIGCKLPLSEASHCEKDFGPHLAINGIKNNPMDFFCSMFHATGFPWLLGIK